MPGWLTEMRGPAVTGRTGRAGRLCAGFAAVALVAGCTGAEGSPSVHLDAVEPLVVPADGDEPPAEPVPLSTDAHRSSPGVVASGGPSAPYNYGPTVLRDGGRYRAWWCSQLPYSPPPGDDILHAEATEPGGQYRAADGSPAVPVFSGNPGGFDGMHTCDPSVIKVDGVYYLYYTGAPGDHADGNAIGVASSHDGLSWTRLAEGRPVVTAAEDEIRDNAYGAGQPAVLHLDGWFHLMFTDTTAAAAGWNGAGQFVLRARDPEFRTELQALTEDGFRPVASAAEPRTFSVVDAFSADWMWVEALDAFAIAHQTETGTSITFWDREFRYHPYQRILVEGPWREGPGLVRDPLGHAPTSVTDPCGRVPIDLLRATTEETAPTGIAHFGLDIHGIDGCRDAERAAAVLDGFAVPSPERTVDVVVDGALVRVERRSVAERLAVRVLDERVPALEGLPVIARVNPGATAVNAPDRPLALLLDDDRLWPVVDPEVAELNDSTTVETSVESWERHELGAVLHAGSR